MNGVSEVGIFQPDIFNSKIKVLTSKSKTHRSQHFLLIGIPFNAILSRELLPLQKYAGGGGKVTKVRMMTPLTLKKRPEQRR